MLGAVVGSFLTVCIYRVPKGLNIVRPGSRCTKCGFSLAWFENIPVLSYVLLLGKCRRCGVGYGARHVWIELAMGLVAVFLYVQWGFSFELFFFFALASALMVISWIDIDYQIIPDGLTLFPWVMGLILAAIFDLKDVAWFVTFTESLLASVLGAGLLWLVAWCYSMVTGVEGLGFGDVKLIGCFGAFFGYKALLVTLFLGSFLGAMWGIGWILFKGKNKRTPIPFGPFLCLGLIGYLMHVHDVVLGPLLNF